ncbi:hypothetical protein DER46DRAFT_665713 [Fusarium sp. MPI-SDFR-AT-0072]|nr:hypothetical protein DER46DRAFT_665713 [Fusarium sp. MPI-SDFR-AT-0072]
MAIREREPYTMVNQMTPYAAIFDGKDISEYLRLFERYMDNTNMPKGKRAMMLEMCTVPTLVEDFEFKKLDNNYKEQTTQSENVLNAIHQEVLDKVALWHKKTWDKMKAMPYEDLTRMIRLTADNEIAKAKNHRHLEEIEDAPEVQKPKPAKNPPKVILQKDSKLAGELSVDDLADMMQKLQINLINAIKDLIKGYIEMLNA